METAAEHKFITRTYLADSSALKDDALFTKYYYSVAAPYRRAIDSLRRNRSKRRALASIFLFEQGLTELGISLKGIKVKFEGKKPYITSRDNLFFSPSYSEDIIITTFSTMEVGCSIQKLKTVDIKTIERRFSGYHFDLLKNENDLAKRQRMFFRLLALEESFLKASNIVQDYQADNLDISIKNGELFSLSGLVEGKTYYFKEYDYNDLKIACCGESAEFEENYRILDFASEDDFKLTYYGVSRGVTDEELGLHENMFHDSIHLGTF